MLLLILVRFVLRDTTPFKVAVLFSSDTLYAFSTTFAALPIARPTESLVKISVTTNKNRSKPFFYYCRDYFSSSAWCTRTSFVSTAFTCAISTFALPIWNSLASREINCSIVFPLKSAPAFNISKP